MRSDGIVNDNARVSTYGPTLDTQSDQLRTAGCSSRNIYRGKGDWRTALRRVADRLPTGKVVIRLKPDDGVTA